jgi:hypothetical protein
LAARVFELFHDEYKSFIRALQEGREDFLTAWTMRPWFGFQHNVTFYVVLCSLTRSIKFSFDLPEECSVATIGSGTTDMFVSRGAHNGDNYRSNDLRGA